ncbi:bifunctional diguanylate cyclase/phosphodiesterase [Ferrovum sp.]|uniref:putative bifunctional diguanylate cyclase/phosphodiesterase n=1 Tax=Ferrovum sp. TaxID=2609467 RepID=UPI00262519B5|nr:bifunctional diguanylate cyclase/phosphodiesterase [Ferrovum sp.]
MKNKTEIQYAQLRQLLSVSNVSLLTSVSIATILAYVQREVIPFNVIVAWYSFMVLASLLRASQIIIYQRYPSGDAATILGRLTRFRLVILISSQVWGAAGWLLFPAHEPKHQVFLILMLAGMTVGGVVSFSVDLISAIIFSVSVVVPITIRLFTSGEGLFMALGMAMVLYLCFMIMSLLRINRNICDNITLRLEATEREEFVRASEERYRLLLNYSPVGIFHYDTDLVITYCNNRLVDILKRKNESIIGLDMKLLDNQALPSTLRKAFGTQIVHYEGLCCTPFCDADLWLALTCASSRDCNGNIMGGIAIVQDITERKTSEEKINSLAFYDPLTHLPNRRLLMERLHQALSSNTRIGREGALLLIDLDNFKSLNDTLGHHVGDLYLQQIAQRLISCVRKGDTVARLGGDEFVILLETLSGQPMEAATQVRIVGEKILTSLSQPYQLETNEYHSTASVGATLFTGHSLATDELLKQADIAMYQAKKAGRNTVRFFDEKMQERISARFSLEGELRKALGNRQFQLHYQIQVDDSNRAIGAEALIRWNHPLRGMVSPLQFIPLAEETGLILPIGLWVLETACAQLKSWERESSTRDLVLAVNVSAKQFRQAGFVDRVHDAVRRHAINPTRLKLELTESMLVNDIEGIIATMNMLNEIDIQFSMDDFGTGYSSLQYLKRLPLDQLKIDMSFTRDLAVDSDNTIVKTIIAMARSLNLDVIAEGVGTEEQRQLLSSYGCHHYQGYLFGRPVPIKQFEVLVKQGGDRLLSENLHPEDYGLSDDFSPPAGTEEARGNG